MAKKYPEKNYAYIEDKLLVSLFAAEQLISRANATPKDWRYEGSNKQIINAFNDPSMFENSMLGSKVQDIENMVQKGKSVKTVK